MTELSVSCVIPTHGRPDYLREALESVLAQTKMPIEIIVVSDDGNPDSEAVVGSFQDREIPVLYVRNEAQPGASGSRNLGAEHASGAWLAFLDDDDLWTREFLEHAEQVIGPSGTELVVSWVEMFRGARRADGVNIQPGIVARDAGSRTPGLTGSNFVMSRTRFESLGGFDADLRVLNDIDLMYRYLLEGGTYEVNPHRDLLQRRHGEGQLTRPSMTRADGVRKYITKHRSTLRLGDIRHLKFVEHRTRYNAAVSRRKKFWHLAVGIFYASLLDVRESLLNRKKRDIWH